MASLIARFSSFLTGRPPEPPLLRDIHSPPSAGRFLPFSRPEPSRRDEGFTALTDLLVSMRESIERQGQRHEELMTYLSHLPKAMELMPETSRQQAEALSAVRQHLENQGANARQMQSVLEKVGQAAVDQRRILDAVRLRLDMLAEHDQKVAQHFDGFAGALTTSSETARVAGEILKSHEATTRDRDAALERLLKVQQGRHTILIVAAILLAAASLVATAVSLWPKLAH